MTHALIAALELASLPVRWLVWALDLDDGSAGAHWRKASPSLAKLAGAAVIVAAVRHIWIARDVSSGVATLVGIGITALFGRSAWKLWIARNEWKTALEAKASRTDARSDTRTEAVTRTVTEAITTRREEHAGDGWITEAAK